MKPLRFQRTKTKATPSEFSAAPWNANAVTLTANNALSPDGRMNATRVAETTATDYHFLKKTVTAYVSGTQYVMEAYVKPYGSQQWVYMDDSYYGSAYFDIVNGVVGNVGANTSQTKIQALSGGWFYIALQFTNPVAGNNFAIVTTPSNGGAISYAGATTKGFYIWKANCFPGVLTVAAGGGGGGGGSVTYLQNRSFEETNPFTGVNVETAGGTVTKSTTRATHGSASARMNIDRAQSANPHRAEIHSSVTEFAFGVDYWVGFNAFLENWSNDTEPEQIWQWHNVPNFGAGETWGTLKLQTPFGCQIRNNNMEIVHSYMVAGQESNPNGTVTVTRTSIGAPASNVWAAWVIHCRWHYQNGHVEVWHNGTKVYEKTGHTYYNDETGPYHKIGVYKWPWGLGYPGLVSSRTMHLDNWKIASGSNIVYADVNPTL